MRKSIFKIAAVFILFLAVSWAIKSNSQQKEVIDYSQWTNVFEAKTGWDENVFENSNSGYWIRILKSLPNDGEVPHTTYKLFFLKRHGKFEKCLYEESLGEGVECHILFYHELAVKPDKEEDKPKQEKVTIFLWVDGQRTCAYAYHIFGKSIKKVFEKTEGRSFYNFCDIDSDGVPEIIQYDSSWHLIGNGNIYTKKYLSTLRRYKNCKVIYKFIGDCYKFFDLQPDRQSK